VLSLHNTAQAELLFKNWIRNNKIKHATVTGNQMMLHDQYGLEKFQLTWIHSVASLTIWDTWLRRQVYLD
jgi:hypothetical protein